MSDLVKRLREQTPEASGKSMYWGRLMKEAADALEAKDAEIERLHTERDGVVALYNASVKRVEQLQTVVQDIDRWLEAFIKAWDQNAPHKGSQAPVALMEAIRQHESVRAALDGTDCER